jgi:UTP-glucose-1-phosphate uridylyltransferase
MAYTGVGRYAFTPAVWKAIDEVEGTLKPGAELDDIPVMQLLLNRGLMTGCLIEGRFLDVGLPTGSMEANAELSA